MTDEKSMKVAHPASIAGLTTFLVGASILIPGEWKQPWILGSTFLSPFLVEVIKSLYFRISIPAELIQYNAALKRDLNNIRKELKRCNIDPELKQELVAQEKEIVLLMTSAHRDFSSGKLKLAKPSLD